MGVSRMKLTVVDVDEAAKEKKTWQKLGSSGDCRTSPHQA